MSSALIVDLETTGLESQKDSIIEIGIIVFSLETLHILTSYGALEDPQCEIPKEVEKITGLNNTAVAGQKIDWGFVQKLMTQVDYVIAHNMDFERGFLTRRPELDLRNVNWACSLRHIDWHKKGFKTRSLQYLAADHGFLNPFPHRALFDCATTYKIAVLHLAELIQRSQEKEFRLWAIGAPFSTKDALRSKGYQWSPEDRVWRKNVLECDLSEERQFLLQNIYENKGAPFREEALS